ncbi:hypothetical protein ACLOJK_023331 [Asimina triloba]
MDKLPEDRNAELKELEMSQKMILEFFQSHNLRWYSTKRVFFLWCQDLSFFGALMISTWGGAEEHPSGEALGSLVAAQPLTGGSQELIP